MKQLGEKVLGWFVVSEDEDGKEALPVAEIDEPQPRAPLPPVTKSEAGGAASPPPVDEVKKVMDLIASLPDGAPVEVKRAIVTASLEAFGIRIDRVLGAATQTERALEEQARRIDQEIAKQQRMAKSVAEERARLRAVGAFFGKS